MSVLSKEELLVLKEQFKSVHNVLPSRFIEDDDDNAKQTKGDDNNHGAGDKSRQQSILNDKDTTNKNNVKKSQTLFQLPGANNSSIGRKKPVRVNEDMENSTSGGAQHNQSGNFNYKKYNYTKNSLNCIPLSSKIRQLFIRFVEWKHQSNLVLVFVTINSVILGMVDYRFKGKYSDKDAPLGNYILGITEPIFAVLFTAEALVKIVAQGFILSKKTYLRDSWNVLDFAVVITALMSFSPDISSVSILRAFRLFKPLRNLQVFPSMRLLIRTLIASANRLRFLVIFYLAVIMMFAIIGVNLMQGATTFRCRETIYPVNGEWIAVQEDHRTCGWSHKCEKTCGSLYDTTFIINGTKKDLAVNVTDLNRDSQLSEQFYGYASFNNLILGVLTLFQISTLQNWYKIMYMLQDSYNSYISGFFFVIYLLITNYFIHILTVGIIMQRFIEYNDHSKRQLIYQKIMGLEEGSDPINIEDLKNKIREDEMMANELNKLKKRKSIQEQIAKVYNEVMSYKGDPIPKRSYYKRAAPRICWGITQSMIYELSLALAAVVNAISLAFLKYPEEEASQLTINIINFAVVLFFSLDFFLRLIAQGFSKYFTNYENLLYTAATAASIAEIVLSGGNASPISAFMVLKIYKILMRSGYYVTLNQLIDSIIFTLSVVMSYCAIMILFVYIFSLLGMQFFAGRLRFDKNGLFDPINGEVPRQNFDTIMWSTTTVLQILIGDDWSLVMFNCMLATGWYSCFYFVTLILFGFIILMNLFQAILIGNFEEASVIMRDTKFLKQLQQASEEPADATTPDEYDLEAVNKSTLQRKASLLLKKQPSMKNPSQNGSKSKIISHPQITVNAFQNDSAQNQGNKPLEQIPNVKKNQIMATGVSQPASINGTANINSKQDSRKEGKNSGVEDYNDVSVVLSDEDEDKTEQIKYLTARAISKNLKTIKKNQPKVTVLKGKTGMVGPNYHFQVETQEKKPQPIRDFVKNSSCCLFHKKTRLRKAVFKVVIDPDYEFKESKKIEFDQLATETQEDLLNQGFNSKNQCLHRDSTLMSIKYVASQTNVIQNTMIKNQKTISMNKQSSMYQDLHQTFNYIISLVIFLNIIFLLIQTPNHDSNSQTRSIVKNLDLVCTIIFIIEAALKILALGFIFTSLENQSAYLASMWNFTDFFVIVMAVFDLLSIHQLRYDGLMNSFKSLKIFHLLKLMKKNDLMVIIKNTMIRAVKPTIVALTLSLTFIFIYALVGVGLFRGKYYYCQQLWTSSTIDVKKSITKQDCNNWGGNWVNFERNFDNIFIAMLTLFEMMSSEDWLTTAYRGIDVVDIDMQPQKNHSQNMLLYFLPFMIIGNIFIWKIFGGVVIENFNRARDKFYDYALMTSEQRNWVEMQRFLIDKRLKVKIDDQVSLLRILMKDIVNSNQFDYFILGCIMINTALQAISYYGNPKEMDEIQLIASYIFAGIFNLECILKLLAFGKYYFWESHNIFDFALIIGTDLGILLTAAFPNFSIGPLAALLRAFRIGRILRLLKEKKSLKILIDTIFYIFPILSNIVIFMFIFILIYSIIGMYLFAMVMHKVEINDNANFETLGGALLLLFRCTTGEKWNLLMREYTYIGDFKGKMCVMNQSFESYINDGPMLCGTQLAYYFFLSYVVIMQLMIVNLFTAVVLEGFAQFSIQNNSVVSSQDYDQLIELWSHYDPLATGWIKPKHLAFLMYELSAPLGKGEDYKEILKKTLDHNTMIKQYSDKKAINMKTKFIYNEEKGLILPHSTVMKLLLELSLPVYNFEGKRVVHFKDVCLTVTKKAIQKSIDQKQADEFTINDPTIKINNNIEQLFDKIPEEQQTKLNEVWKTKYKNLQKAQLIEDYDTGKLWAGLYILKMIRSVNNGFGRSQFKKKLAQNRLFKKLQRKNAGIRRANMNIAQLQNQNLFNSSKMQMENSPVFKENEVDNEAEDVVSGIGTNSNKVSNNLIRTFNKNGSDGFEALAVNQEKLVGGPQRRGRSPMMKDQGRSTWWQQGDQRQHYVQWMQSNNMQTPNGTNETGGDSGLSPHK